MSNALNFHIRLDAGLVPRFERRTSPPAKRMSAWMPDLVRHAQPVRVGEDMEAGSEIAKILIYSRTARPQTQITIQLNAAVQDKLGFVNAATRVTSVVRAVS